MSLTWIAMRTVLLTPWLGYLCVSDVKSRRLPNAWTLGGLLAGLAVQTIWGGGRGFTSALAGAGVCVLFLLVPCLLRAAGAGDMKMLAACGAFVGLRSTPLLLMAVSFSGLLVALWMICAKQVTTARLKHCFRSLFDWRYDRKAGAAAIPKKDEERARIPFGVAIALGTWATLAAEAAMGGGN